MNEQRWRSTRRNKQDERTDISEEKGHLQESQFLNAGKICHRIAGGICNWCVEKAVSASDCVFFFPLHSFLPISKKNATFLQSEMATLVKITLNKNVCKNDQRATRARDWHSVLKSKMAMVGMALFQCV